ncbi:MAG TPA: M20/M25/M40 family metallo-hydrolase [Caulobacter sp.]|nr:M20/M25/M40 family metallo-hydrolase [Caulobacter sp.]
MTRFHLGRTVWLIIALALAALLAWQGTVTPRPVPASAPADAFSAERALRDIAVIAREPHPVASPANARVRDHLLRRMTDLGLSPTIQETDALSSSPADPQWLAGAHVQNIVGILPGRDRAAPALVLMSHYDSVPGSPGAADDAAGVAASLEVVRALKARGVPARDVIVLVTDGEEWGLSGAEAYFAQHPLARRTGLVINMEARGNGGRANMFETGADNGELIDAFRTSARKPISSALAVFLYEKMPNDTDFSVPKRMGMTGLNFAFIGRQFDYHSPTATVANLDPGSVQSMGEQVLASAGDLAFAPRLPGKAPSAVYSQTFGDHVLAYPPAMGWLVLALAGGLLLLAGWRARRAGERLAWIDGLRGAGGLLLILTLTALVLNLTRRWTGVGFGFMEQRPLLAQWGLWETVIFVLGLGLTLLVPMAMSATLARRWMLLFGGVLLGALSSLFGGFDVVGLALGTATGALAVLAMGRPVARNAAWAGALLLAFVLAALAQLFAPQVAFLLAWPLTLAALGAAVSRWGADGRWTPLLALIAAVVCGWLGVYVHLTAQGLDFPALLGLFALLAALVLWPLAQPDQDKRPGPVVLATILLAIILAAGSTRWAMANPWSERHPQAYSLMHVTDVQTGKAWVTSPTAAPGLTLYSRQPAKALTEASLPPLADRPVYVFPVPAAPVAAPTLTSRVEPDGRVSVVLTPPPGARVVRLNIKLSAAVKDVTLQGRPAAWLTRPNEWQRLRWVGPGRPVVLSFRPVKPDAGLAEVEYGTLVEAWPQGVKPPPGPAGPLAPWGTSGSTGVIGKAVVRW